MFDRTLKVLNEDILNKINKQKILLVGVGGVGGYALESLVRLGFKDITIIDNDIIDISNLNRQLITNMDNIGNKKVLEAKKRALSINKNINIKTYDLFLNKDNINEINNDFDYIIDACDFLTAKVLLIKMALSNNIKIISCMGTGNRINPSKITITNLDKTYNDPLAKKMRNTLKKEGITLKIPVVYSSELPLKAKNRTIGSIALVPASAGLNLVYYILNDIINN